MSLVNPEGALSIVSSSICNRPVFLTSRPHEAGDRRYVGHGRSRLKERGGSVSKQVTVNVLQNVSYARQRFDRGGMTDKGHFRSSCEGS